MRAVEIDDLHPSADEVDERQEQGAVQAILVETFRRDIRGRDNDDAALEQCLEEAAEDHRIGDVGHAEFVETDQPGFVGYRLRDRRDRIIALDQPFLQLLAEAENAGVNIRHEGMEMHAPFARDPGLVDGRDPSAWSCRGRRSPRYRGRAGGGTVLGAPAASRARRLCGPDDKRRERHSALRACRERPLGLRRVRAHRAAQVRNSTQEGDVAHETSCRGI